MQAVGGLFTGILTSPLKRKRAMYVVNLPHLIAWSMLYFATSVTHVFIACALLGFGNGLMESPVLTYIGEISWVNQHTNEISELLSLFSSI